MPFVFAGVHVLAELGGGLPAVSAALGAYQLSRVAGNCLVVAVGERRSLLLGSACGLLGYCRLAAAGASDGLARFVAALALVGLSEQVAALQALLKTRCAPLGDGAARGRLLLQYACNVCGTSAAFFLSGLAYSRGGLPAAARVGVAFAAVLFVGSAAALAAERWGGAPRRRAGEWGAAQSAAVAAAGRRATREPPPSPPAARGLAAGNADVAAALSGALAGWTAAISTGGASPAATRRASCGGADDDSFTDTAAPVSRVQSGLLALAAAAARADALAAAEAAAADDAATEAKEAAASGLPPLRARSATLEAIAGGRPSWIRCARARAPCACDRPAGQMHSSPSHLVIVGPNPKQRCLSPAGPPIAATTTTTMLATTCTHSYVIALTFCLQALLIGCVLSVAPLAVTRGLGLGVAHVGLAFGAGEAVGSAALLAACSPRGRARLRRALPSPLGLLAALAALGASALLLAFAARTPGAALALLVVIMGLNDVGTSLSGECLANTLPAAWYLRLNALSNALRRLGNTLTCAGAPLLYGAAPRLPFALFGALTLAWAAALAALFARRAGEHAEGAEPLPLAAGAEAAAAAPATAGAAAAAVAVAAAAADFGGVVAAPMAAVAARGGATACAADPAAAAAAPPPPSLVARLRLFTERSFVSRERDRHLGRQRWAAAAAGAAAAQADRDSGAAGRDAATSRPALSAPRAGGWARRRRHNNANSDEKSL